MVNCTGKVNVKVEEAFNGVVLKLVVTILLVCPLLNTIVYVDTTFVVNKFDVTLNYWKSKALVLKMTIIIINMIFSFSFILFFMIYK